MIIKGQKNEKIINDCNNKEMNNNNNKNIQGYNGRFRIA